VRPELDYIVRFMTIELDVIRNCCMDRAIPGRPIGSTIVTVATVQVVR
jgi:hypothetical protein